MKGIADGAKATLEEIVMLNARHDLSHPVRNEQGPNECTSMSLVTKQNKQPRKLAPDSAAVVGRSTVCNMAARRFGHPQKIPQRTRAAESILEREFKATVEEKDPRHRG